MRLVASLALLAALSGCALGPPALPQPNGPMIAWNTGMWGTSSNATVPGAQGVPVPVPLAPVAPAPAKRSAYHAAARPAPATWAAAAPVAPAIAVAPAVAQPAPRQAVAAAALPTPFTPPNLAEEMH